MVWKDLYVTHLSIFQGFANSLSKIIFAIMWEIPKVWYMVETTQKKLGGKVEHIIIMMLKLINQHLFW